MTEKTHTPTPEYMKWHKGQPHERLAREDGSEWFFAKLKDGKYAALKALPENYSYDYTTNDGTYYKKDWVVAWAQNSKSQYIPLNCTACNVQDDLVSSLKEARLYLIQAHGRSEREPLILQIDAALAKATGGK